MSTSKILGQQKFRNKIVDKDVIKFIINQVKNDSNIIDGENNSIFLDENSWVIWEVIENESDMITDNSWMDFSLFYPDEDGDILEIEPHDISKVFIVGLTDYDTAYRINIFQTTDNQLWLGCNNPD